MPVCRSRGRGRLTTAWALEENGCRARGDHEGRHVPQSRALRRMPQTPPPPIMRTARALCTPGSHATSGRRSAGRARAHSPSSSAACPVRSASLNSVATVAASVFINTETAHTIGESVPAHLLLPQSHCMGQSNARLHKVKDVGATGRRRGRRLGLAEAGGPVRRTPPRRCCPRAGPCGGSPHCTARSRRVALEWMGAMGAMGAMRRARPWHLAPPRHEPLKEAGKWRRAREGVAARCARGVRPTSLAPSGPCVPTCHLMVRHRELGPKLCGVGLPAADWRRLLSAPAACSYGTPTANHQPPPAANRQPPAIVHCCFCGFVYCACLDHEAASVPVNICFRFTNPVFFYR